MAKKTDDDHDNVIEMHVDKATGEVLSNGSKTLEQIADEMTDEANAMHDFVHGTQKQLTLDVGGRKPTGSVLKIKGYDMPLIGQFPKNKTLKLMIDVSIEHVSMKTVRDRDRHIIGTDRIHHAEVTGVLPDLFKRVEAICEEHGASEMLMGELSELLG